MRLSPAGHHEKNRGLIRVRIPAWAPLIFPKKGAKNAVLIQTVDVLKCFSVTLLACFAKSNADSGSKRLNIPLFPKKTFRS